MPRAAKSDILIRTATEPDLEAIARIHIDSRADAYKGVLPENMLKGGSVSEAVSGWRNTLTRFPGNLTVADLDGEVRAFCCAGAVVDAERNAPFDFEIYGLHAAPSHRQKGLGAALVWAARERAIKEGFRSMIVWTFRDLILSRRFYEREGAVVFKEGIWKIGDHNIPEVAYGWRNLLPID